MIINNENEFSYISNIIYTHDIDIIKEHSKYLNPNILVVSSYTMNTFKNYKQYDGTAYELYYIDNNKNINQLTYNFQEGNGLSIKDNKLDINIDNNTLKTKSGYIYVDSENFDIPSSINKGVFQITNDLYYNSNYNDIINNKGGFRLQNNTFTLSQGLKHDLDIISYYNETCNSLYESITDIYSYLSEGIDNVTNIKPGSLLYLKYGKTFKSQEDLTIYPIDDNNNQNTPYMVCVIGSNILPDRCPRYIPLSTFTTYSFDLKGNSIYVKNAYTYVPIYTSNSTFNINYNTEIKPSSYGFIATNDLKWKNNYRNPFDPKLHYYIGSTTELSSNEYQLFIDNSLINSDYSLQCSQNLLSVFSENSKLLYSEYSDKEFNIIVYCIYKYQDTGKTGLIYNYLTYKYNFNLYLDTDSIFKINYNNIENNSIKGELVSVIDEYDETSINSSNSKRSSTTNISNTSNNSEDNIYSSSSLDLSKYVNNDIENNIYGITRSTFESNQAETFKFNEENENDLIFGCGGGGGSLCISNTGCSSNCATNCSSDCSTNCSSNEVTDIISNHINRVIVTSYPKINITSGLCNLDICYLKLELCLIDGNKKSSVYTYKRKYDNNNGLSEILTDKTFSLFYGINYYMNISCYMTADYDETYVYNLGLFQGTLEDVIDGNNSKRYVFNIDGPNNYFSFNTIIPTLIKATCVNNFSFEDDTNILLSFKENLKIINQEKLEILYNYVIDKSFVDTKDKVLENIEIGMTSFNMITPDKILYIKPNGVKIYLDDNKIWDNYQIFNINLTIVLYYSVDNTYKTIETLEQFVKTTINGVNVLVNKNDIDMIKQSFALEYIYPLMVSYSFSKVTINNCYDNNNNLLDIKFMTTGTIIN